MAKVYLDPGHGGKDPGAIGNNLQEKNINLSVTLKIGEILKKHGVEVEYSRTTDVFVDLTPRANMANKANADIFVSIHCNSFTNKTAQGVETFYNTGSIRGKILATDVQNSLIDSKVYTKNRGVKSANFTVIAKTTMPAILVELAFISNAEDANILRNKQDELTIAVAKGILKNLRIAYKEVTGGNPQSPPSTGKSTLFRVQVGAFSNESNAVNLSNNLKMRGYNTYLVKVDGLYRVQVGAYSIRENAEKMLSDLKRIGFNGFIREETLSTSQPDKTKPELITPNKPVIITPNKKSIYFEKGDAKIIKTRPDNIEIPILGKTLHGARVYGVNGTLFETEIAPVTSGESCVMIAMNKGKVLSNNAQFNGWNAPPRATLIYHTNKQLGFRQLKNVNPIRNNTEWAIGGFMVKPYMDFKNEQIPGTVNYRTNHTYIAYDSEGYIYLIVKLNHMIREIVPLMNELGITNGIVLDGGGSSQLNHPDGQHRSTRAINTAILLKEA